MNYGDLLKDSFWIVLRNRFLWVFGLFAGGGGGSFGVPSGSGGNFPQQGDEDLPSLGTLVEPARRFAAEHLGEISLLVGFVLLITLLFIAVGALCTGALAGSVAAIDRGEGRRFGSTFGAGVSAFPRVFGLVLVFAALYSLLFAAIGGAALFLSLASAPGSLPSQIQSIFNGLALAALLAFAISIPLGIVAQFALREVVVRGEGVFASIGNGYRLFRRNLGRGLLLWFIQIVVGVGAGVVFVIAMLIVAAVFGLPAVLLLVLAGKTVGIVALVFAGVALLAFVLVLSAAVGTFNHAYWTLAYLRLTAPPTAPREPLSTTG